MPAFAPNISATVSRMKLKRRPDPTPAKICGMAPGRITLNTSLRPVSCRQRALSIQRGSSITTPCSVLIRTGPKTPRKMMTADESQKDGRTAMAYGISMVGGTGFRARKSGIRTSLTFGCMPTASPQATPARIPAASDGISSRME